MRENVYNAEWHSPLDKAYLKNMGHEKPKFELSLFLHPTAHTFLLVNYDNPA